MEKGEEEEEENSKTGIRRERWEREEGRARKE